MTQSNPNIAERMGSPETESFECSECRRKIELGRERYNSNNEVLCPACIQYFSGHSQTAPATIAARAEWEKENEQSEQHEKDGE